MFSRHKVASLDPVGVIRLRQAYLMVAMYIYYREFGKR